MEAKISTRSIGSLSKVPKFVTICNYAKASIKTTSPSLLQPIIYKCKSSLWTWTQASGFHWLTWRKFTFTTKSQTSSKPLSLRIQQKGSSTPTCKRSLCTSRWVNPIRMEVSKRWFIASWSSPVKQSKCWFKPKVQSQTLSCMPLRISWDLITRLMSF